MNSFEESMELTHYFVTVAILILSITIIYYYLTWNFDYWKRKGAPQIEGPLPGFGNLASVILFQKNLSDVCKKFYESMPQRSMVGFYFARDPCLLIRDPDLVKEVLVGSFSNFSKNGIAILAVQEIMLAKNPVVLSGPEWKTSRSLLLSVFTGTRMKALLNMTNNVCEKLSVYTDRKILENHGVFEPELKDFCSRITGEVYAVAALGTDGYCFDDPPLPNSLRNAETLMFGDNFWSHLSLILSLYMPTVCRMFRVQLLPSKFRLFFREVAESTVKSWIQEKQAKSIFLQTVLQYEEKKTKDEEQLIKAIMMQTMMFFLESFETTSITLSFLLYQLSLHPDVQQKLRQEIKSVLIKNSGNISMNDLSNMTYMTQVLNESLRLHEPASVLMKVCTGAIKLTGSDGLSVLVEPDNIIFISLGGLQHDPKYWHEPDQFKPERFKTEHGSERHKFIFLPFGEGRRMCPGKRFAEMVIKMALVELLPKYSFEPSSKVRLPLKYHPTTFLTYVKGGLWAKIKRLPTNTENAKS